jgi:hypothetical protein
VTRRFAGLCAAACFALPGLAAAQVDVSKPLLCAVTEAIECPADGQCASTSAEEINIPAFLVVDAKAKRVSEHKGQRTTPAQSVTERDGHLYLQGIEERVWSAAISASTGQMALTASRPEAGFVVFGVCTEL